MFFRVIAIFIIAFQTIIFDNLDKYIQRNMNANFAVRSSSTLDIWVAASAAFTKERA